MTTDKEDEWLLHNVFDDNTEWYEGFLRDPESQTKQTMVKVLTYFAGRLRKVRRSGTKRDLHESLAKVYGERMTRASPYSRPIVPGIRSRDVPDATAISSVARCIGASSSVGSRKNPVGIDVERRTPTDADVSAAVRELRDWNPRGFVDRQDPFFPIVARLRAKSCDTPGKLVSVSFEVSGEVKSRCDRLLAWVQLRIYDTGAGRDVALGTSDEPNLNGHPILVSGHSAPPRNHGNWLSTTRGTVLFDVVPGENVLSFVQPDRVETCVAAIHVAKTSTQTKIEDLVGAVPRDDVRPSAVCGEGCDESDYRLSLRCPISLAQIRIPSRGRNCRHARCFDLETYIKFCDGRNRWNCPVCDGPCPYRALFVDARFEGIVSRVGPDVDSVIVKSDGRIVPCETPKEVDGDDGEYPKPTLNSAPAIVDPVVITID
jgi:hypothetical protein